MGNICGKESKSSDPFSQPGRTIGSAPPSQSAPRASVPKISGQGQTLGGSGSGGDRDDARRAAARAAEVSFLSSKVYIGSLCVTGTKCENQPAEGEAGKGSGTAEEADEDRDAGEHKSG